MDEEGFYELGKGKKRPITKDVLAPQNLRNNMQVLSFARTYTAVVVGMVCGILGVTGWQGIVYHLVSQLLCIVPMIMKGSINANKYFMNWWNLITVGMLSQNTIMTFILSWMLFYNICYVF